MSVSSRSRACLSLLALCCATLILAGCWSSELRRVTIAMDGIGAWAGQDDGLGSPDSLITAVVPVTAQIPELAAGEVQGVEEVGLYIQIQNASFEPVEAMVIAHRSVVDRDRLLAEGVRLTEPILIQPQSALQLDGRNYRLFATGFEELSDLILGGDFHLYVASEADVFSINGNVPTLTLLVSIEP